MKLKNLFPLITFTSLIVLFPNFLESKEYKLYEKMPCRFNGVKVGPSATPYINKKEKKNRCCKSCKGYEGKKGTSIESIRNQDNLPIVAITDMTLVSALNRSSLYRCMVKKWNKRITKKNIVYIKDKFTNKKKKCETPFDNIYLNFIDDKNNNFISYYHLKSTPLVPGFNKKNCKMPKYQTDYGNASLTASQCGGIKKTKVKKGEIIGYMGFAGNAHFSLGIGPHKNTSFKIEGIDCSDIYKPAACYNEKPNFLIAPEDKFKWENIPKNKNAYLLPILKK